MGKADHAAIGRASRAKGNRYQREAAAFLNECWAGTGWECTVTGIYQRRAKDKSTPDLTVTGLCKSCGGEGHVDHFDGWEQCAQCHGTGTRTLRGECKGSKSLPLYLWRCTECGGDGHEWISDMHSRPCPRCHGSGLRGPKRKPREEWWRILEGVRCESCKGSGQWPSLPGINERHCAICHGTGWLSHPHDFLIVKRYNAKPACERLVLVRYPITTGVGGLNEYATKIMYQTITHPDEPDSAHPTLHDPLAIMTAADWAAAICNVKE